MDANYANKMLTCEICDYKCSRKSDYDRHLLTKKHKEIIDDLEQKLTDSNDKNLRLLAEFENFKNRSQLEKNKLIKYEGIDAFRSMLSILDDFDRTLKLPELKKNKSLDKGLSMIVKNYINIQ